MEKRIIQKVYKNNTNNQKLVTIPKESLIQSGDYVEIIKIDEKIANIDKRIFDNIDNIMTGILNPEKEE